MSWNQGHGLVARVNPGSLGQTELPGRTYYKNYSWHLLVFTVFRTPKRTSSSHECTPSDVSQDAMLSGVRRGALVYSLYLVRAMLKFCQW